MALGKARGMQPPRREDADEKQPMGIGWKDGDAVGPAGAGDARPQDGGIQRVSRDGEMRGGGGGIPKKWSRSGALTFNAFFAASASERLSKLTKPTGCRGRRGGTINHAGGEQRGDPPPRGPVMLGEGGSLAWDAYPILSSSYLFGGEFDERSFVPLQEKNKKRVFGGDPHDSAAPERGKPPASITWQPYSWGGGIRWAPGWGGARQGSAPVQGLAAAGFL